jgi:hypothetical protein
MLNLFNSFDHKEFGISCLLVEFLIKSRNNIDKQRFKCEFEVSIDNILRINNEKELIKGKCKLNLYAFKESEK